MSMLGRILAITAAALAEPTSAEPFCAACRRPGEEVEPATFGDYGLCSRCLEPVCSRNAAFRRKVRT